jgi:hypothetical protein
VVFPAFQSPWDRRLPVRAFNGEWLGNPFEFQCDSFSLEEISGRIKSYIGNQSPKDRGIQFKGAGEIQERSLE